MQSHTIPSSTGSTLVFDVWPAGNRWTLLVHGLSSNARTWWQVAERLANAGEAVITVDQRSHGRSEVADDGYDWPLLAADLIRVLDAVGADRVMAAGQSWGANVVLETAAAHSERIRGIVSVDGAYAALSSKFPDWESCRAALRPAEIRPVPREVMRRYLAHVYPHWSDAGIDHTLANFRETNGYMERALPIPHHMKIVRTLWEHDPEPLYVNLDRPSTVISAAASTDHIDVGADEVLAVPGDHDLHVEQPDRIAQILGDRSRAWVV